MTIWRPTSQEMHSGISRPRSGKFSPFEFSLRRFSEYTPQNGLGVATLMEKKWSPDSWANSGSVGAFFNYYNHVHRHSGIALRTPSSVHYGTHVEIREQRQATLSAAFEANPIRFRRRPPQAPTVPEVVRINPPIKDVFAKI